MKILFEGINLTDTEAQQIFDIYITEDYKILENEDIPNGEYAIFSNKKSLLKAETICNQEDSLYSLKIVDLQKDNIDEETLKFKVLTSKKTDDLEITYNQIVTLIEAMEVYKENIKDTPTSSAVARARVNFELSKVEIIKNYFEQISDYNHQTACINCYNKKLKKKESLMGLGEGAFEQSARIKKGSV